MEYTKEQAIESGKKLAEMFVKLYSENSGNDPVYYQPELTEEEWETGDLPSFGVYANYHNCKRDYPNHNILAFSGNDIEEPTYMD